VRKRDPIASELDGLLEEAGFVRKKQAWYLRGREVTAFAELQRSQWGPEVYLNLAAWVQLIEPCEWPRGDRAHLRLRLGTIVPANSDVEVESTPGRAAVVGGSTDFRELVRDIAIPTLRSWTSIEGIRRADQSGALVRALVDRRVRDLL